jgi:predicted lipoprotein with Yx(FWY)xxD motif
MRGRIIRWALPLAVAGIAGAGVAMAASASTQSSGGTVNAVQNAKFGMVLVAANGKTLYRYTPDSKGVNRCSSNATCKKFWPALLVKPGVKPTVGTGATASLLGTIKAAGGMRQVTYGGWPLYYFAGDKKAGQVNGQGFDKTWYVVNTKGALVKNAVNQNASNPSPSPSPTTTSSGSAWG